MARDNNDRHHEPDVDGKNKLHPSFGIGIQAITETSFNAQVKIKPCYEPAEERVSHLARKEGCSVGSDYVGIKDESIDCSCRNSEVEHHQHHAIPAKAKGSARSIHVLEHFW